MSPGGAHARACAGRLGSASTEQRKLALGWHLQKRPEDESYGQEMAPGPDSARVRRVTEADRPQPPAPASASCRFSPAATARGADRGTEGPVRAVTHASPALSAEGGHPVTAVLHRAFGVSRGALNHLTFEINSVTSEGDLVTDVTEESDHKTLKTNKQTNLKNRRHVRPSQHTCAESSRAQVP